MPFSSPRQTRPTRYQRIDSIVRPDLNPLYQAVRACTACPHHLDCTAPVPGVGDARSASVMVVLEAPAANEDQYGVPVTGATWEELEGYLRLAGLSRDTIWLTNTLHCYVLEPKLSDTHPCFDLWFPKEVEAVRPKLIVACGQLAIRRILDDPQATVEETHGRLYGVHFKLPQQPGQSFGRGRSPYHFAYVLPTYHPAAGFYNAAAVRHLRDDFRLLGQVKVLPPAPAAWEPYEVPRDPWVGREQYTERPLTAQDFAEIQSVGWVALDTEVVEGHLWCASFSWRAGQAVMVKGADLDSALPIFDGSLGVPRVLHNALYDLPRIREAGFLFDLAASGDLHDTLLMARILQTESAGLKELGTRYLSMVMSPYAEVVRSAAGSAWLSKAFLYLSTAYRLAADLPGPGPEMVTVWNKESHSLETKVRKPQRLDKKLQRLQLDWLKGEVGPLGLGDRWLKYGEVERRPVESLLGSFPEPSLADVESSKAVYYSSRDADATGRLYCLLPERLRAEGLWETYINDVESLPLIVEMIVNGVGLDADYLRELAVSLDWRQAELESRLFEETGELVNVGSDEQVAWLLFDQLDLPVYKRTKVKQLPSTDDSRLMRVRHLHPAVDTVLQWRQAEKAKSTYCAGLPKHIGLDGRIHCDMTSGTVTGRIAAKEPNLLALPNRTELGKKVREAIVPGLGPSDRLFVAMDYGQIELRCVADLSRDERLTAVMMDPNGDAHHDTACLVFRTDSPTADQRRTAKIVNFGIIYDVQGEGLFTQLETYNPGIWTLEACRELIAAHGREHPGLLAYKDQQRHLAHRDGFVRDMFGRRLYVPEVYSHRSYVQAEGERKAINGPVQMGAQGIIRRAMGIVYRWLRQKELLSVVRSHLQIHDELLFSMPSGLMPSIIPQIQHLMETATSLPSGIPIRVSVKTGPTLGALEEVEVGMGIAVEAGT